MKHKWHSIWMALLLVGCGIDSVSSMRTDVNELRSIIRFDLPISTVRWEMFTTPERGGPTDFVSVVAEIKPAILQVEVGADIKNAPVFVVPGANRAWLSEAAASLINRMRNSTVQSSDLPQCRGLAVFGAKSGRPLEALMCNQGGVSLLYVNLLSPE